MQLMKAGATNIAWYIHQFFVWCYSLSLKILGPTNKLTIAFENAANEFSNDEEPWKDE